MSEEEQWRPVVGHEVLYEVSSLGRVRSLPHTRANRWGTESHHRGRLLTRVLRRDGYLHVCLFRGKKTYQHRPVHVLVLEAFVGPRPDGLVACHWDGDRQNASLGNLRWDTRSANAADSARHGTVWHRSIEACPRGHELVAPNLVRYFETRGQRTCRACHQTHAVLRYRPDVVFKDEADRRFTLIMSKG